MGSSKLFKRLGIALTGMALAIGVGVGLSQRGEYKEARAAETTTTYVFQAKTWTAKIGNTSANWTSVTEGSGFSNSGIQVTTTTSGANATSPSSFTSVSRVVLTYHTNGSKGAGTFDVKIGTNDAENVAWAYDSSKVSDGHDGTNTDFTATVDYATPQNGAVKVTVNTSTNSCYLVSCAITYDPDAVVADSVSFKADSYSLRVDETLDLSNCVETEGASTLSFSCVANNYVSLSGTNNKTLTANNVTTSSVTVTATKGDASDTVSINVTAAELYENYTSAFKPGYYVLTHNSQYAVKNTITSNKFDNLAVSLTNGNIKNPSASIVWKAEKYGDYWTFYNETAEKYLGSTSSKNTGELLDDVTDYAKWSISVSNNKYSIENYGRANSQSDTGNKYLRFNGGNVNQFAAYASGTGSDLVLYRLPSDDLQSIAVVGATTTFTAGQTFAFGGTVTATYSITGTTNHTGITSGLTYTLGGNAITTSIVLTKADHGKTLVVTYTDAKGDSASAAGYTINVNYKATTSISIAADGSTTLAKGGSVGLTATITDQYANPNAKWITSNADIVSLSTTTSASGVKITATASSSNTGDVTITAYVDEDNSGTLNGSEKSDTIEISVSDAAILRLYNSNDSEILSESAMEMFASASDFTWHVVASSFGGDPEYTWSSSDTDVIAFADFDDECVFDVLAAGTTRLSCRAVRGNNDLTVYVDVTVVAVAVSSVTWDAVDLNVYSGYTGINTNLVINTWEPQYHNNDGTGDYITENYTVKLGGVAYTLGTALTVADNGKDLTITYDDVESEAVKVYVTQSLNSINKPNLTEYSHTLAVADVGTGNSTTYKNTITMAGISWTPTYTWNDGVCTLLNSLDGTRGLQLGSKNDPLDSLELKTSGIANIISKIVVHTTLGKDGVATLSATVNDVAYSCGGSTSPVALSTTASEYVFTGTSSGEIKLTWNQSTPKGLFIKYITVYSQNGTTNIANVIGHEAAQAAVVKFAKAFNTAMSAENVCGGTQENLATGWTNASGAYTTFLSDISSLSEAEQNYAKSMIANATAVWTTDTDSNYNYCLERAMATYEYCVTHHSGTCTAFMSAVRPVGRVVANNEIMSFAETDNNMIIVIAVVSAVSLLTIGGYFFIRRRKER